MARIQIRKARNAKNRNRKNRSAPKKNRLKSRFLDPQAIRGFILPNAYDSVGMEKQSHFTIQVQKLE